MIDVAPLFSKSLVFKCFPSTSVRRRNAGVFKFLRLKSDFEKFRFHDGLVWTVGLTVEIQMRFQISPAYCERCQSFPLKSFGLHKIVFFNPNEPKIPHAMALSNIAPKFLQSSVQQLRQHKYSLRSKRSRTSEK